jgi:hypothetical protein
MQHHYEEFAAQAGLPAGWLNSLPSSGVGQSCALCGANTAQWLHALNPSLVQYRVYGKGHTLPTFWTLCQRCERYYQAGNHEVLIGLMRNAPSWESFADEHVDECVRQPLAVFARADLGPSALSH